MMGANWRQVTWGLLPVLLFLAKEYSMTDTQHYKHVIIAFRKHLTAWSSIL
jgi:hypothetical protein